MSPLKIDGSSLFLGYFASFLKSSFNQESLDSQACLSGCASDVIEHGCE
jgi:hypothetical protein